MVSSEFEGPTIEEAKRLFEGLGDNITAAGRDALLSRLGDAAGYGRWLIDEIDRLATRNRQLGEAVDALLSRCGALKECESMVRRYGVSFSVRGVEIARLHSPSGDELWRIVPAEYGDFAGSLKECFAQVRKRLGCEL